MRFRLKAMAFTNRPVERADGIVSLSGLTIDSALDGRSFRIDRADPSRCRDFPQRSICVVEVQKYARQPDVRCRVTGTKLERLAIELSSFLTCFIIPCSFACSLSSLERKFTRISRAHEINLHFASMRCGNT